MHEKKETKNENDGLKNLCLECCLIVIHNSSQSKPISPLVFC